MTLVVFDMDGTLLNAQSEVTPFTAETLTLLRQSGIAYTVATGRTLQAALGPLKGCQFELPHILKNGAVIWCPEQKDYSHRHLHLYLNGLGCRLHHYRMTTQHHSHAILIHQTLLHF